jgi:putative nucleotidyltransferase with HDIG domain
MSVPERLARIPSRLQRRPSLLVAFLVVSAGILAGGAVVLGVVLTDALRAHTVGDARRTASTYVDRLLRPWLARGGAVEVNGSVPPSVRRELAHRSPEIVSVKVWAPDGTLAWASVAPARIGRRYPVDAGLAAALRHGRSTDEIVGSEDHDRAERLVEARDPATRLLEVYAPVRARGRTIGAYEVYVDARSVLADVARGRRVIWLVTAAVFAALWVALAVLVRGASRKLRRQTRLLREHSRALTEAYDTLERRSLEAIESLNATIEARDPLGAGQSLLVQRIALAIGRELGLGATALEALAHGALLHDIGNIAVPETLLGNPGRLTPEEYEHVKLHADEGAAILARLSPLRRVVPIVRHHHERWDGAGYPDGLAGGDVPLGAAIVAVAEAWAAMTSNRPYRCAMDPDDAVGELLAGRGSQFSPAVVDAFLRAAGDRPRELWLRPAPAPGASRAVERLLSAPAYVRDPHPARHTSAP